MAGRRGHLGRGADEAAGGRGDIARIGGPGWVDSLVSTLNTPFISGLLLFLGFFMLIVEMKLPGIGLPAITATLAFLLFFWSRYLGGTADGLEIILFIVGLLCLALELFVFPGFGVFGMSGVVLILFSVVMASHTFIVPTKDMQYREMGRTLIQLIGSLVAVFVGAILLGRFFPSLPLFNKLILRPEEPASTSWPSPTSPRRPPWPSCWERPAGRSPCSAPPAGPVSVRSSPTSWPTAITSNAIAWSRSSTSRGPR